MRKEGPGLAFYLSKTNRYSVTALVAAVEYYHPETSITFFYDLEELGKLDPEEYVLAFSFSSFDLNRAYPLILHARARGFTIVAGGPHPSARPHELLEKGAKHVVIGDGEKAILKFLHGECALILREPVYDLENFPPFAINHGMYMPIEITRGCPFRCAYCQVPNIFGRKVRHRSVENVLHWIKEGIKRGKKLVRFISPNAFGYASSDGIHPNVDAIARLLEGARKLGVEQLYFGSFPSDVRPESVTPDVLGLVKKFCDNKSIIVGAQSGSIKVLKKIKRGHDVETVERAVAMIRESGLTPHVDMIFGFPFETDEDVEANIRFMERLIKSYSARIHAHTFMPLPGSDFENMPPGKLGKRYSKVLGYYAARGALDGMWYKQEQLARYLDNLKREGEYENKGRSCAGTFRSLQNQEKS